MRRIPPAAVIAVHPDLARLEALRAMLAADGHRVLATSDAERAIELLAVLRVCCVLAARDAGGRGGLSLLSEVHRRSPQTALVLLGGDPDPGTYPHVFGWLQEDCGPGELLGMVRLAVDQALLDASAQLLRMQPVVQPRRL
jgi:DNA-binding NtrC family response regulator